MCDILSCFTSLSHFPYCYLGSVNIQYIRSFRETQRKNCHMLTLKLHRDKQVVCCNHNVSISVWLMLRGFFKFHHQKLRRSSTETLLSDAPYHYSSVEVPETGVKTQADTCSVSEVHLFVVKNDQIRRKKNRKLNHSVSSVSIKRNSAGFQNQIKFPLLFKLLKI